MLKNCIKNWKRIDDDMATDVAQREHSKIKCYASAFSNILIDIDYIDNISYSLSLSLSLSHTHTYIYSILLFKGLSLFGFLIF